MGRSFSGRNSRDYSEHGSKNNEGQNHDSDISKGGIGNGHSGEKDGILDKSITSLYHDHGSNLHFVSSFFSLLKAFLQS